MDEIQSKRARFDEENTSVSDGSSSHQGIIGQRVSIQVLDIQLWLSRQLNSLTFSEPVSTVYNPIEYAGVLYCQYVQRFCDTTKAILVLGMNPGPWGMAQTGIPFGEVSAVKEWLQLVGTVSKPYNEHPLRPITGLDCHRSEISGRKFWGLIRKLSGNQPNADAALSRIFVHNFCPILFLRSSGCNITPAELKADDRRQLYGLCDEALRATVAALHCQVVLGVGRFAETRATTALKHSAAHVRVPSTECEWRRIATEFQNKWQYPGCLGALNGKHVEFRPFREYGSIYCNYKGSNSIVLLALVDANYNFIYVDVNGRTNDGSIFKASTLKETIDENLLNFPPPVPVTINQRACEIPYTIVADDAFCLDEHVMKRYPIKEITKDQRIFNYRLSRARRVVENAFGILSNRFRVLLNAINQRNPLKVEKIALATVALHNFLNTENDKKYIAANSYDREKLKTRTVVRGAWRDDEHFMIGMEKQQGDSKSTVEYMNIRNDLTEYFLYANPLPWQEKCINLELH